MAYSSAPTRHAAGLVAAVYSLGALVVFGGVFVPFLRMASTEPGPPPFHLLQVAAPAALVCVWLARLASGLWQGRFWARIAGGITFPVLAASLGRQAADCAGGWGLVFLNASASKPGEHLVACGLVMAAVLVGPALAALFLLAIDARGEAAA